MISRSVFNLENIEQFYHAIFSVISVDNRDRIHDRVLIACQFKWSKKLLVIIDEFWMIRTGNY